MQRRSGVIDWAWANPWKFSTLSGVGMFAFMALFLLGLNLGLGGSTGDRLVGCLIWGIAWFAGAAARYAPTPQWMRRRHP